MSTGVMKTAIEALTCKSAALGYNESADGSSVSHRKTPLLNRIYRSRSKLMHKLVSSGLKTLRDGSGNSAEPQLLLLGAGLDTSYNSYTTRAYAVDFAHVITQRASITSDKPAIKLIVGDLREADVLMSDLQCAGFDVALPTVILLECVLSYVEPVAAQQLLSTLSSRLSNAITVMYDPVLAYNDSSNNGLAKMMHEKFAERSAPLLSCALSVAQYMSNLRIAGWNHVSAVSVNQAAQLYLSAAERRADVLSEPFDEFASLALLQNCYAVAIACTHKQAYKGVHELVYAGKVSPAEREQALQDRVALAEARLTCIETHLHQKRQAAVPVNTNASLSAVSIRRAQVTDTHTLVQVYQSAFEPPSQKYASVKKYVKFSLKALKEFEKTYPSEQKSALFVAQGAEGSVVGCIGVKVKHLPSQGGVGLAELSHFCVSHESQRGGVGQALLAQAVSYCREVLDSHSSVCLTVLRDLEAARRLYAAEGFEHASTEKLGNDCELYTLRLNLSTK